MSTNQIDLSRCLPGDVLIDMMDIPHEFKGRSPEQAPYSYVTTDGFSWTQDGSYRLDRPAHLCNIKWVMRNGVQVQPVPCAAEVEQPEQPQDIPAVAALVERIERLEGAMQRLERKVSGLKQDERLRGLP
jgi:hypothetical protein